MRCAQQQRLDDWLGDAGQCGQVASITASPQQLTTPTDCAANGAASGNIPIAIINIQLTIREFMSSEYVPYVPPRNE